MDCSMPGFPVLHQLLKLAHTHVHWVSDAIETSHPLLSHSPPAFNLSLYSWGNCIFGGVCMLSCVRLFAIPWTAARQAPLFMGFSRQKYWSDRGWNRWMSSPTQWTWVWASSGRWWRTGRPGVLQSMGSQRVRQNWITEQQQQKRKITFKAFSFPP